MNHEPETAESEREARSCRVCRHDLPFDIPQHLLKALQDERLVVFAGAGVSTEREGLLPHTFYDDVKSEVDDDAGLSFGELMSRFCDRPDGRSQLLLKARNRISYVVSHPELYEDATRFHRELATVWQITEIVTTNWDDFFEKECGATAFITSDDLAFWTQPGRKVLKLHGSVHNLGAMVLTAEDYADCHDRLAKGLLGAQLKTLLASRTVAFVGYSLTDPDLRAIVEAVTSEMKGLRPAYYVVSPDAAAQPSFPNADILPIRTDGTHFLRVLKEHLLEFPCNLPDDRLDRLPRLRAEMERIHIELLDRRPSRRFPETIHCASYQDGLMHALDRAMQRSCTGDYSHRCELQRMVRAYEKIRKDNVRRRAYHHVAYAEGYTNGLILLAEREDLTKIIPRYYVAGATDQPRTFTAYRKLAKDAPRLHKAAYRQAVRIARDIGDLIVHHPPFF